MPAQHSLLSFLTEPPFVPVPHATHVIHGGVVSLVGNLAPPCQWLAEECESPFWPMRPEERFPGAPGKFFAHYSRNVCRSDPLTLFLDALSCVGVRLRPLTIPHHQARGWRQYNEEDSAKSHKEIGLSTGLNHPWIYSTSKFPDMSISKSHYCLIQFEVFLVCSFSGFLTLKTKGIFSQHIS